MKLSKIIAIAEKLAPPKLAEFDYVGLLIGDKNKQIEKIGVTLDYSVSSIKSAIGRKCDLLVVHHGPDKKNLEEMGKEELKLLLNNNLAVYRAHLNLDFAKDGIIDNLCKIMRFNTNPAETFYMGIRIIGGVYVASGKFTFDELIKRVSIINPHSIRFAGVKKQIYRKIAISSGAGFKPEFFEQLKPDAYISGELNQKAIKTAEDLGITLIEATHHSTENLSLKLFSEKMQKTIPEVKIEFIDLPDSLNVIDIKTRKINKIL